MQRVRDSPVKNLKFCGDSTGLIEPHWCSLYLLSNAGTKRLWADDMCSIYLFPKFSLVCWVPPSHYIILHNCSLQNISYCISFILCNRLWFCLCLHFVCYMVICHFIPTEGSVGEEFLVLCCKRKRTWKGQMWSHRWNGLQPGTSILPTCAHWAGQKFLYGLQTSYRV